MNEIHKFSFEYYKKTLEKAKELGYNITCFRDVDLTQKKVLLLRHDVEFSLEKSYEIAKIENKLGFKSTFFLRVHSNEYNIFSFRNIFIINQIIKMGHEIGLHSENLYFKEILPDEDSIEIIKLSKKLIEDVFKIKVISVSDHGDKRTHRSKIHPPKELIEFIENKTQGIFLNHAYEDRFFKQMKYISDSNGVWREGDLNENLGTYDKIQVLTHPFLWYEKHYYLW